MTIKEIAQVFEEISVLLELKGENPFKVRAYSNAARSLKALEMSTKDFIFQLRSSGVRGFGAQLSEHIITLHETHSLPYYEQLHSEFPEGLLEFLKIPGLGAKKVKALYQELNLITIEQLKAACEANSVSALKGFGAKTEQNILQSIERYQSYSTLFRYSTAAALALQLRDYLRTVVDDAQVEIAGSLRRKMEVVKDIDLVAATENPEQLMEAFVNCPGRHSITARGETKSSLILSGGIAADLRVVTPQQFASTLLHFSGSKEHTTALRSLAKEHKLKLNEYGLHKLLQDGIETPLELHSEQELYAALGLSFIAPELREGLGEVAQAQEAFLKKKELPELVCQRDLRGILHVHTTYSDGANTLEEMALATRQMGLDYLGVCDHSRSASYAGGLSADDIKRQHEEIDKLNEKLAPFRVFKGIESDILADGSLDYEEEILSSFDFIVASVHSRLGLDEKAMTERIVRAVQNPYTTILGHTTGRLLLRRESYQVDLSAVLQAAADFGVAVEINANPRRLDLDWRWHQRAVELGVQLPICPDAHSVSGLEDIQYGIGVARKGGLLAENVLNTKDVAEIEKFFVTAKVSRTRR